MQVLSNYIFYKDKSEASTSADMKPFINTRGDVMCIEISGTATTFSISIEGRVNLNNNNTWYSISGIKTSDLTKANSITATGVYTYDISGFQEIRVNIASISGGNVTAFGRIMETGC